MTSDEYPYSIAPTGFFQLMETVSDKEVFVHQAERRSTASDPIFQGKLNKFITTARALTISRHLNFFIDGYTIRTGGAEEGVDETE